MPNSPLVIVETETDLFVGFAPLFWSHDILILKKAFWVYPDHVVALKGAPGYAVELHSKREANRLATYHIPMTRIYYICEVPIDSGNA